MSDSLLKIPVSAVLCTYNEDEYLDECLASLQWADEILLFDMGSTDRSVEIARRHGCKIHFVDKVDYVEIIRERAVSFATNAWICFADPDWVFVGNFAEYLNSIVFKDPAISCVSILCVNHFCGRPVYHGNWKPLRCPCVFDKSAMELRPILHDGFVLRSGRTHFPPRQYYIKHYWIRDESHFEEKHLRYLAHEGENRQKLGYMPSKMRSRAIIFKLLKRFITDGILDGKYGYNLFKKSVWYECEAEQRLLSLVTTQRGFCPVCGQETDNPVHNQYDDRYGFPGNYFVFHCSLCKHAFCGADFTPDRLTTLYTDYYPRSSLTLQDFQPSQSVHGFNAWLNGSKHFAYAWIPENVSILDIGCGFGQTLAYHKSRGCEVYGVEVDENIRRVAEKFDFNVHVGVFDSTIYQPDFFDYVTLDQVIEHVVDPIETLRGICHVLKPGGMAILSTPNAHGWGAKIFGRRWINWHAPYHLQHFSVESMAVAAEKAGLRIEDFRTLTSSEWLHYQWLHLLCYPRMGEPSAFWSPNKTKSLKMRLAIKFISLMHLAKVNHIISRFFDLLGIGDNSLFFLRKI